MKTTMMIAVAALAVAASGLTVEEARANLRAARAAYTNALVEAGMSLSEAAKLDRQQLLAERRAPRRKAAAKPALTKAQQSFFDNRRIAVKRDTETLPGYVITTWYRNGKPDTKAPAVVTNLLHDIVGAEQHNPLQVLAERYRASADEWRAAATNATARVERVSAALDEKREEYVAKRDAAALPSTKAIYQAFIDAIDRIKEKLDEGGK